MNVGALIRCQNEECGEVFRVEADRRQIPTLDLCALCSVMVYLERLAHFSLKKEPDETRWV